MMKNKKKIWVMPILVLFLIMKPVPVMGNSPALVEYTLEKEISTTYTTQEGDTLWSVGHKFGIKPTLLALANNMQPEDLLAVNRELVIPLAKKIKYRIQPGDTLWDLAKKYDTTVESLAEYNHIGSDDNLQVGQSLLVCLEQDEQGDILPAMAGPATRSDDSGTSGLALEIWPVNGIVSSGFGIRDGRMHEGIDLAADKGKEIKAVANGIVVFAGPRGSYGKTVIINHGRGFRTLYAHASSIDVSAGDTVNQGQVIARVGSTGRSTGPHLHMEVLYKGTPLDPMDYLP